jgi:hypothetical protein
VAKVLSQYLLAIAANGAAAGLQPGKSANALDSIGAPLTLQLQHVRLQI